MNADTAREFSRFAKTLDYPMYVVTTSHNAGNSGCLIGFGIQCSVHPPRSLACLSIRNHTFRVAAQATHLAVHVVEDNARHIAELFGGETGDQVDKFRRVNWRPVDGLPILDDCPRWFIGSVLERFDLGDHVGHLLEPVRVAPGPVGDQLTYQKTRDITPGHDP